MNWNLFKREQRAIKITRTYNGVQQPVEYRTDTPQKIQEIIEHINRHPGTYINATMNRDGLENAPSVQVKNTNEFLPSDRSIKVLANVHYEYRTATQAPTKSFTVGGLKLVGILGILFLILLGFTMVTMEQQHEKNMIDQTCFMYLKNGTPQSIEIDGTKYNMNADGTIDDIDAVFLNPHHRELLAYQQCVKVNH